MKAALDALMAGFVDGSIKFTKKRWADSDPYHPAAVLMCAAIEKAEEDHPADTKSDPETEVTASTALAAFWSAVLNRHPGNAVLEGDVLIRLEAAAYDAIEAWRAEQAVTLLPDRYDGELDPDDISGPTSQVCTEEELQAEQDLLSPEERAVLATLAQPPE